MEPCTCWETIALNLMEEFPDSFSKITARFSEGEGNKCDGSVFEG
jgi:hypothetical protein